jgi:hypothetical protein
MGAPASQRIWGKCMRPLRKRASLCHQRPTCAVAAARARNSASGGGRTYIRPLPGCLRAPCSHPPASTSMPPPVITDATNSDEATLLAAASLFLPAPLSSTFLRCTGGVNNVVFYLDRPDHPRLILRIYNNGRNTARVAYEHAVLHLLAPLRFSFSTPRPLPSLSDGSSFALLPSGAACCVTECIPGGVAENGDARAIGRATAELVRGMAPLRVPEGVKAVNPLYRNFWVRTRGGVPRRAAPSPAHPAAHPRPHPRPRTHTGTSTPPLLRGLWNSLSSTRCAATSASCGPPLRAQRR